jgi:hypothetical protein
VVGLLLGNVGIGLSYGWWSEEQARERRTVAARALAGWQAFLFFPLRLLDGLNLHASSIDALRTRLPEQPRCSASYPTTIARE